MPKYICFVIAAALYIYIYIYIPWVKSVFLCSLCCFFRCCFIFIFYFCCYYYYYLKLTQNLCNIWLDLLCSRLESSLHLQSHSLTLFCLHMHIQNQQQQQKTATKWRWRKAKTKNEMSKIEAKLWMQNKKDFN